MSDKPLDELKAGRSINLAAKGEAAQNGKSDCSMHSATMCPAFGALRVTMRIEGLVPVLVGAVGCLYGLDFVSHFYAANKPIVSPSLTPRELVQSDLTDKVLDIVKEVVEHENPRMIAVMSLCTPETSGLHLELIPRRIGQTEIIPMRVPAYSVPTHAEAKDVAISQILKRIGENNAAAGVASAQDGLVSIGEVFPTDPVQLQIAISRLGIKMQAALPSKEISTYYDAPKAKIGALLHPFYDRTARELREQGLKILHSAPVGAEGTFSWFMNLGRLLELPAHEVRDIANDEANKVADELEKSRLDGTRIMIAGYEGGELLFARLMIEAGATVTFVSTSVRAGAGTKEDAEWLAERGVKVIFRKRHEDDIEELLNNPPDLCIGSSNLEAHAKRRGIPSVYFTNIVSARPLLLSSGVRPLVEQMKLILSQTNRYTAMRDFFADAAIEVGVREPISLKQ
ncbi:nitrogenase component 1 [Candidatus Chlorohelix sp.]|uniref:nitrogenase component 1 n=1 Tax=Candidatus Chlorohelix sp. TaxID=3139201 RepID=UPI00303BC170